MAKVEVKMPQMGESITEGTIITWHKQPGDEIEQDETLLEIGTDKVDTDVPAPEDRHCHHRDGRGGSHVVGIGGIGHSAGDRFKERRQAGVGEC
jgi:hypothetical protein